MILNPVPAAQASAAPRPTLDDLLRRAVQRAGDAPALLDPADRPNFTHGPPRRLTWAELDGAVGTMAARLLDLGLGEDAVIGIQLPNTVESLVALLGVMRAGMIAAPMPLLWRRREAAQALGRVGAQALVTIVTKAFQPTLAA